ncbi:MAG: glycosyltransferase [Acidimicrobiia bacterium]|nr:glycosyltransferase [Acidimicrobiia bacterium]
MTTLMVTAFAPYRDGIATYAAQEIRFRRAEGERIEVVSPLPSAAQHHLPLGGVRGAALLLKLARNYDRAVIQFGPELLHGACRTAGQRTAVWSSVVGLARLVPLELRVHEIAYQPLADNPAERRLVRLLFGLVEQVTVHTEPERELLRPLLGDAAADRIEVIDHGRYFVPAVTCTPEEAKAELGLDTDEFVFLSIGFIQHHKGFDRAVEAFSLARLPHSRLHIVGSGRIDHPDIGSYVAELTEMCSGTEGVDIHNRFVSDDQFDLWLTAADAVILPYRQIWSSSVVERARLFDKPVIVSDLDQLRHQIGDRGFACADVAQLAVAMEKLWSGSAFARRTVEDGTPRRRADDRPRLPAWEVDDREPDRAAIEAQIARRAGTRRPAAGPPGSGGNQIASTGRSGADRSRGASPGWAGGSRSSTGLAALGSLERPAPVSARPGVAPVKQAVQRATGWQLDPLYRHIVELQQATLEAIVEVESRLDAHDQALAGNGDDRSDDDG